MSDVFLLRIMVILLYIDFTSEVDIDFESKKYISNLNCTLFNPKTVCINERPVSNQYTLYVVDMVSTNP